MSPGSTFLWHDYETFGTHPALDRPAQFAALRTDENLQEVDEPLTLYCKPSDDVLPHPYACLVTGITPQEAFAKGLVEAEFARRIHTEMSVPNTCSAGFNNLRFDDEFTRNLFYRNFIDPYEREWRNGNSRWDLIDLTRMCYALRPGGIEWPRHEDDQPSFRLEDLCAANRIAHSGAHDALSDVRATLGLARRVREAQPRLFAWALRMRDQAAAMESLNPVAPAPLVHTSARYPATRGCTTLVLPLAVMPDRPKSVVVFDLMGDPDPLLELPADDIADRVFTPAGDMPDTIERIPLKLVHTNRVPMLAPGATLRGVDTHRIGLEPDRCRRTARRILEDLDAVRAKVIDVFRMTEGPTGDDPDCMLYSGGFFSRRDRAAMNRILKTAPEELAKREWNFEDPRLERMLFRFRARNYPHTLTTAETERWHKERTRRLLQPFVPGQFGVAEFRSELAAAREEHGGEGAANRVLDQLEAWLLELHLPADAPA